MLLRKRLGDQLATAADSDLGENGLQVLLDSVFGNLKLRDDARR